MLRRKFFRRGPRFIPHKIPCGNCCGGPRKKPFCNTKYLVNTLFTHISTSFGINIRLFPANLLKTPSNDKILPEASSCFFTDFGFNKHNIKVIVGKNNTNSFSKFALSPNGGLDETPTEHAARLFISHIVFLKYIRSWLNDQ